jgi:hypothetical protein
MKADQISIATITWARTQDEENLLHAALRELARLQIRVFVTDGGSSGSFLNFLRSIPHFTILQAEAKGVWAQAKKSLLTAYDAGTSYILYTEPDKLEFFRQHLGSMLSQVPEGENTGIFLASRSAAGFDTFPRFQQMTETTINNCCREIIGKAVDYTYGPFLINRDLIPYLELVQEDIGWGWRPYAFGIAHRQGYQVQSYTGDFACPPDQREDNATERIYRMRQLNQNIQGLVLSTNIPLSKA